VASTISRFSFVVAVLALGFVAYPADAATENVILTFIDNNGNSPTGSNPTTGLISDAAGNLYGTTYSGVVYELSSNGDGGWNETILHTFAGSPDGQDPAGDLLLDNGGNLYGSTFDGGTYGNGILYKLSPAGTNWTETILYNFSGKPGDEHPYGPLLMDRAGNFYLVTGSTIVEVSPVGGSYTSRKIHRGDAGDNIGGLTMDASGNIFCVSESAVFELAPNKKGGWSPHVLHKFAGSPDDGASGWGNPIFDVAGNLYGTTQGGGATGGGTVFELIPGKHGKWSETTLYSFEGQPNPSSGIVFDAAGNAYGTTMEGGDSAAGTVFELVAPVQNGRYQLLWSFNDSNGDLPIGSPVLDKAGNLYGATFRGGSEEGDCSGVSGCGVVYQIVP
jgi:uncharacterized repeat protein (TIGR03803 family)